MLKHARPSGLQIAFFIVALSIVAIPISRVLWPLLGPDWEERQLFRLVLFGLGSSAIILIPRVRRSAASLLNRRIPGAMRLEVTAVAALNTLAPYAVIGAYAVWALWQSGPAGPQHLIAGQASHSAQMNWSFSKSGVFQFFGAVFLAPFLEELVFRGFLFNAWAARWGWLWAAVLTSTVFAAYHPHFFAAFVESLVYVAAYRRTGSLRAAIAIHAVHNLVLWYPLLGQFAFPSGQGNFSAVWNVHLAALALAILLIPLYVWLAHRTPNEDAGETAVGPIYGSRHQQSPTS